MSKFNSCTQLAVSLTLLMNSALVFALPVSEDEVMPAIIYDTGGKFDKSYNEMAYEGAQRFKMETGLPYAEVETNKFGELEPALRKMVKQNASPIVALGFISTEEVYKVALQFPKSQFVVVDAEVNLPNVKSVIFREEEGGFLVGAIAAMKSKTGKVGFIGGMDIPIIRKFSCGFEQGAKYINPKAKMLTTIVGTTVSAWNDPTKGMSLAKNQFKRGVDVIFAVAGGTGNGVYQAAKDQRKFAIGVDANQNYLFPGAMLTSMVKRIDVAVLNAFKEGAQGRFKSGTISMGLAENGVDFALDEFNRDLITPDMENQALQIKQAISNGTIQVRCGGRKSRVSALQKANSNE